MQPFDENRNGKAVLKDFHIAIQLDLDYIHGGGVDLKL